MSELEILDHCDDCGSPLLYSGNRGFPGETLCDNCYCRRRAAQ